MTIQVSAMMVDRIRAMLALGPLERGKAYRLEGLGELWFSLDPTIPDQTIGGVLYEFRELYTIVVDGMRLHFFSRQEK